MRMVPRMPPIYMWFSCNASEPHWSMRRSSGRHVTAHSAEASPRWHPQQSPAGGEPIPYDALSIDGRPRATPSGQSCTYDGLAASCQRRFAGGASLAVPSLYEAAGESRPGCRRCLDSDLSISSPVRSSPWTAVEPALDFAHRHCRVNPPEGHRSVPSCCQPCSDCRQQALGRGGSERSLP